MIHLIHACSSSFAEPPIESCLAIFKYTNSNGEKARFSLKGRTSNRWRDMGIQLGIGQATLDGWRTANLGQSAECWVNVMSHWLDNGSQDYSKSWEGLYELLEDLRMGQVAKELRAAVESQS